QYLAVHAQDGQLQRRIAGIDLWRSQCHVGDGQVATVHPELLDEDQRHTREYGTAAAHQLQGHPASTSSMRMVSDSLPPGGTMNTPGFWSNVPANPAGSATPRQGSMQTNGAAGLLHRPRCVASGKLTLMRGPVSAP